MVAARYVSTSPATPAEMQARLSSLRSQTWTRRLCRADCGGSPCAGVVNIKLPVDVDLQRVGVCGTH